MDEEGKESHGLGKKMTRREFLKLAGVAAGAVALSTTIRTDTGFPREQKERPPQPSDILMIDFAPQYDNASLIKRIMGEKYLPKRKLAAEFGRDFLDPEKLKTEVFKKYPELAIIYGVIEAFAGHGKKVASALEKTRKIFGGREHQVQLLPLQDHFDLERIRFTQDELENPGFLVEFKADSIIESLKTQPQQRVVNLSFQLGEVGFVYVQKEQRWTDLKIEYKAVEGKEGKKRYFFGAEELRTDEQGVLKGITADGKIIEGLELSEEELEREMEKRMAESSEEVEVEPYFDIRGGYTREKAEKGLRELIAVCKEFPEKMFIAAGGNYNDDVTKAKEVLSGKWPENLVLVAEWEKSVNRPRNNVFGVDIYVLNSSKELGLPRGSSFSTAVISELANILRQQGLSIEQTKQCLLEFCDQRTYQRYVPTKGYVEVQANIFNPQKTKTKS